MPESECPESECPESECPESEYPGSEYKNRLEGILRADPWSMDVLGTVRSLHLPDWAIGAGFVRALVWDHLSGQGRTRLEDVDVLYFDPEDISKERERELQQRLLDERPLVPWSVKNQARMHIRNRTAAYGSTEEAIEFWLETPTAVAVRLELDDRLSVLAPYGLDDLFRMIIRPTPKARLRMDQFESRLARKPWLGIWPDLKVVRRGGNEGTPDD